MVVDLTGSFFSGVVIFKSSKGLTPGDEAP
jgi:hypothetical protein